MLIAGQVCPRQSKRQQRETTVIAAALAPLPDGPKKGSEILMINIIHSQQSSAAIKTHIQPKRKKIEEKETLAISRNE